jgi:hypothetical protein
VALTSAGLPLYTQKRTGRGGRTFLIYKLRTMVVDAEKNTGPVWAKAGDSRVTRVGKILRKTRLDEFPQLWNVLRGDMSLVGPRPERPEFVDFWALKWGDLLRVTRNGMGAKGMWQFHSWLQRSIQANRPIDQMVREILLARGQPNTYGPAAFYRIPQSSEELAETVSQTFMGLSLGCAKCHQHPFENLSQNDYYGMAAFFARLDMKADRDYGHM